MIMAQVWPEGKALTMEALGGWSTLQRLIRLMVVQPEQFAEVLMIIVFDTLALRRNRIIDPAHLATQAIES